MAATISALAGTVAAIIALRAINASSRLWRSERRGGYYRTIIADPCIGAVNDFRAEAHETLSVAAARIDQLRSDGVPASIIGDDVRQVVGGFIELQTDLMHTLTSYGEVWEDERLREQLRLGGEQLQDKMLTQLALFPQEGSRSEWRETLNRTCAQIVRTILRFDPAEAGDPSATLEQRRPRLLGELTRKR